MHTLITVFDDHASAERARDKLAQSGIEPQRMHLEHGSPDHVHPRDRSVAKSFGSVIGSMFGLDDPQSHAKTYDEAVTAGKSVLLVDATDSAQAQAARKTLRECGADDSAMQTFHRESMEHVRDMLQRQDFIA